MLKMMALDLSVVSLTVTQAVFHVFTMLSCCNPILLAEGSFLGSLLPALSSINFIDCIHPRCYSEIGT